MKILVYGRSGQVARALQEKSSLAKDSHWIFLGRDGADFSHPGTVSKPILDLKPDWVINAAAYTKVDQAEKEFELATRINAIAVGELAEACTITGSRFVHFSTDYVFPGTGHTPWKETDATSPINAYGRTKLEGENLVLATGASAWIFRTSWVYDGTGANFLNTMLKLAATRDELQVVNDQMGAPTYSRDIAEFVVQAILKSEGAATKELAPTGLYHFAQSGETSWHGFAQKIFALAVERGILARAPRVVPIASRDYPTPAARPLNSRLDLSKLSREFKFTPRSWNEALQGCILRMGP